MRILAISDVHYPRFAEAFKSAIPNHERPDLFLMAGDMVNRGDADGYVDRFGQSLEVFV